MGFVPRNVMDVFMNYGMQGIAHAAVLLYCIGLWLHEASVTLAVPLPALLTMLLLFTVQRFVIAVRSNAPRSP